jgi:hypothetical protein
VSQFWSNEACRLQEQERIETLLSTADENIKSCLRDDGINKNWEEAHERHSGRGGSSVEYFINIRVDKTNIKSVIDNNVSVRWSYPTKYGGMDGMCKIDFIKGNLIKFEGVKYELNIDKFKYLEIRHVTKHIIYSCSDD